MGRTEGPERTGGRGKIRPFYASAGSLIGLMLIAAPLPAFAIELSAPQEALYTTVSIFPPSADSMTVCYGFVCRRREILDFTPADRNALTQILAAGGRRIAPRDEGGRRPGGGIGGPRARGGGRERAGPAGKACGVFADYKKIHCY